MDPCNSPCPCNSFPHSLPSTREKRILKANVLVDLSSSTKQNQPNDSFTFHRSLREAEGAMRRGEALPSSEYYEPESDQQISQLVGVTLNPAEPVLSKPH